MVWIPRGGVEVDHSIERAAAANPFVDGLAFLLFVRVVVPLDWRALEGVLERRQCGADDAHPVQMRARDQLLVTVKCLCVTRWKEALEAGVAPPVDLEATHSSALEFVNLQELQAHALA